ncbi:MAG: acyl-CoA dehydrogenase family protein [Firmicutes bacterium]|nr:acyl-CoA dehydrogenase family protein [Bacillota bacterium]
MDFQLSDTQRLLKDTVHRLAHTVFQTKAAEWDQTGTYPASNVEVLRQGGYLGMTFPQQFGGPELPLIDAVLVVEEIAQVCGVTGRIVVETNMGAVGTVMAYGTPQQQALVADRVLHEGDKPAIAMTEPDAGTDLKALKTTARHEGTHYVINGLKHWITGGGISRTYLVFARFQDARGHDEGIGALLVDKDTPGFAVTAIEDAMGLRGLPEAELRFRDCRVPQERVVVSGSQSDGFKKLMRAYNAQRIGASAVALGIAQGAHNLAVKYLGTRTAFGQKLSAFQGLRWMMAQDEMKLQAARLLIYRAACNADPLANNVWLPRVDETAIAKAYVGTVAFEVTSDALQCFGAAGYSRRVPLERMLRDVRMFQIGGGTTQAQLDRIAQSLFSQ